MENLSQYLDRVMRQKNMTAKDLARACGITNSYIGRVIKGKVNNLTVGTIVALAEGLGIDPHDLFTAASGRPPRDKSGDVDPLLVIGTIQKLMMQPEGLQLLEDWLRLSPRNQKSLVDFLKYMNEQKLESQHSKSRSRRK